jgi:hypothetical protein
MSYAVNIDGAAPPARARVAEARRDRRSRSRTGSGAVYRRSVMRCPWWARSATCALAASICVPAFADRAKRSLATCTSFEQAEHGDDKVVFTIRNACSVPIDCSVSWRVVCAPDSKKRRAAHPGAARFAVGEGGSQVTEASAAICGDDAFRIDSVRWSCQVNND